MNHLMKGKKDLKGGVKGTKFTPKNQGANKSQKVKKNPPRHKLADNGK